MGFFGMVGNVGLLIAGPTIIFCAKYAKSLQQTMDSTLDKHTLENIILAIT